ncbi:hypothetical protein VSX64_09585 [Aurantimonas sp. C2-6-R+9]|uniref:ImuA family protein n=1 Tax=unclassified Aurantimonas TaxID=2638230 RepID=UPI002E18F7D3|nr:MULTISPECIES: hypothetical protein [unclassified Aurantimonas]MEC5291417.1 hypothetical protein [Aurantimonas sp. C2-3-R2]MEC5323810.1 hypothetical protein [Aurantimonas sp. A3-2-R12]MEC5381127.1 hypothetical protein [Aurantimonas sp. C2-6-R+9]MEC5412467.1 hypothetical protein [Aurantimonas sp. C2-4-R8]
MAVSDAWPARLADIPSARTRSAANDATAAGSRNSALARLREQIARIEGQPVARLEPADETATAKATKPARRSALKLHSLGCATADAALGGGFPAAGLTEIHLDETRDGGTLAGFALALAIRFGARPDKPLLWIGDSLAFSEAGLPYWPGLAGFGLDPSALCIVRTRRLEDAAWAGEEAAASSALTMAILEVRGNPARLGLDGTRRLHFRAREAGLPFLLLRQSARAEATAAPLRLRVRPSPAAFVPDLANHQKLIGHPVFAVTVEKSRDGRPRHFSLEWNPHERRFDPLRPERATALPRPLAAAPVDRPDPARDAGSLVALQRAS